MKLGECKSLDRVRAVMSEFLELLKRDEQRYREHPEEFDFGKLRHPYWHCQPYVRPE